MDDKEQLGQEIEEMALTIERESALKAIVNSTTAFPFLLMYAYLWGKGQDKS